MPYWHEQSPNCGIYHVYMIFDMTRALTGSFCYWMLKFVWITTKSCSVMKIDAFTKYNIKLVLQNRFLWNKILMKVSEILCPILCLIYSVSEINLQSWVKCILNHPVHVLEYTGKWPEVFLTCLGKCAIIS